MAAPEILLPTVKQVNINGTVYDIKSRYWGSMDSNNPASSFKKINGQSVYGSGEITTACTYPKEPLDNSNNTIILSPNIFYVWGTVTSNLTITLGGITTENTNFANEYIFQFSTGESFTPSLTISGTTIKWANGSSPNILPKMTYQISILNGCGIITAFA